MRKRLVIIFPIRFSNITLRESVVGRSKETLLAGYSNIETRRRFIICYPKVTMILLGVSKARPCTAGQVRLEFVVDISLKIIIDFIPKNVCHVSRLFYTVK